MPRFVLLAHDFPSPHFDLMLEIGDSLRTWRLTSLPESKRPVQAEAINDHRLAYLDYEGPVSKGRGSVNRVDAGTFEWVDKLLDGVIVTIQGNKLNGRLELKKSDDQWICYFS